MPARRRKMRNPFRGVVDVVGEMNRIADRMTGADGTTTPVQHRGHTDAWSPTTDILANGADLLIRSEIPGVARDDVEISLSRGTLTISGSRQESDGDDGEFYVQERAYGQFRRDITLPEGVTEDNIDADFTEGVLEIRITGSAGAPGPTQIPIRGQSTS